MGKARASMYRPVRAALSCALAVLLVLSLVGVQPARAQTEDSGSVILAAAAVSGLVALVLFLADRGEAMMREQLEERGCPVPDTILSSTVDACIRRTDYLAAHPETDPRVAEMILNGRFTMGMTAAEVEASLGPPTKINRSVTAYGVTEQWVYRTPGGYGADYLYLDDGVLRSWQVSR